MNVFDIITVSILSTVSTFCIITGILTAISKEWKAFGISLGVGIAFAGFIPLVLWMRGII